MIPVPRKLWAQISAGSAALWARRLIILKALTRDIPLFWSATRRPGSQLRKRVRGDPRRFGRPRGRRRHGPGPCGGPGHPRERCVLSVVSANCFSVALPQ